MRTGFIQIVLIYAVCSSATPLWAEGLILVSASYGKNVMALLERDGTILWQRQTAGPAQGHAGHHEIQMLSNTNILFHEDWEVVKEITLQGEVVWRYASQNVHAFSRLENDQTLIAESGKERILVVNSSGNIVSSTPLGPQGRGKTRQAECLPNGNYLVCAEKPGTVTEYHPSGTIVWEYPIGTRVYGAIRLKNGNTMICSGSGNSVLEVTPGKEIVWQVQKQIPETAIELFWTACLEELPNGHLMIANCHAGPDQPQLIEFNQDHQVVWQLNVFDLVGNGMACFDYIPADMAAKIRTQLKNTE